MSCPCGLTKEEVKDFDRRTGLERVPLVGGKCQNPLADGSDGVCGKGLGAHPLAQAAHLLPPPPPQPPQAGTISAAVVEWLSDTTTLSRRAESARSHYRRVGKILARNASGYQDITDALWAIHNEKRDISPFIVIDAPSGSGKTQLGYVLRSLDFQVQHFTLHPSDPTSQPIYETMKRVSRNIDMAIAADLQALQLQTVDLLSAFQLQDWNRPLRLLQYWFKCFFQDPNYSWDQCTVSQFRARFSGTVGLPVVIVDEVGNKRDFAGNIDSTYVNRVRYICNLCRACRIPCIWMGTNSNAMNMIPAANGSRSGRYQLWCKLLTRLPRVPTSREALELPTAIETLRRHEHYSLAALLEATSMTSNPLFVSAVVNEIKLFTEEQWRRSTVEVMDDLLAKTAVWLLERQRKLISLAGLRGQIALQLNMYREEPDVVRTTFNETILNTESAIFVSAHFATLTAPRDMTDLYLTGNESVDDESASLGYKDEKRSNLGLCDWVPSAKFSSAKEDPWMYLLLGGGKDGQHPPAFRLSSGIMSTADALQRVLTSRDTSLEYLMKQIDLSNRLSLKRDGDVLEALASLAVVTASRRAGVRGMRLSSFLCRLAEELVHSPRNITRQPIEVQVCWRDESSRYSEMLDQLLEVVPYLGPFNTVWPATLFDLPGCHFGHFRRTRDKDKVDFSVCVPRVLSAAAAAESAGTAAGASCEPEYVEHAVLLGECKNYTADLDKDDVTQILLRALSKKRQGNADHLRVHIVLVSNLSTGVFAPSSWNDWKEEHAKDVNLQVARVNLSRDSSNSQSLRLSLANLSPHAASLQLDSACGLLVLFIPVELWLGVLTMTDTPSQTPAAVDTPPQALSEQLALSR